MRNRRTAASIERHGISAWPGSDRFADWIEAAEDQTEEVAETEPVPHRTTKPYCEPNRMTTQTTNESTATETHNPMHATRRTGSTRIAGSQ